MKICFTVNNPEFFLSHRVSLAKESLEGGYDVYVVCPDGTAVAKIKGMGFKVKTVRLKRRSVNPLTELLSLFDYWKALKEIRPDVFHGFTLKSVVYGSAVAHWLGVGLVANTITGLGYSFLAKGIKGYFLRTVLGIGLRMALKRKNSFTVFQNKNDRDYFIKKGWVNEEQSKVIVGSGVDTEDYTPGSDPNNSVPQILFPSRMLFDKGICELIQAAQLLHERGLRFQLNLVGDVDPGNYASVSEEQMKKWDALPYVKWVGYQSNMKSWYANSDIVCLPSYREGAPRSLIEASSCGKAIVTTDVPGCRDVVDGGESGLLVEVKSAESLADGLQKLLEDELLRKRLGVSARKFASRNLDEKVVNGQILGNYALRRKQTVHKGAA